MESLETRIAQLEEEVRTWKEHAAELSRQLAAAIKKKEPKAKAVDLPGFDAFWACWPSSSRKVNKKACLKRWASANLEPQHEEIIAHVISMKRSRDWTKDQGAFIPAPLVYLNQERYLAPAAPAQYGVGSISGIKYSTTGIDNDGHFN